MTMRQTDRQTDDQIDSKSTLVEFHFYTVTRSVCQRADDDLNLSANLRLLIVEAFDDLLEKFHVQTLFHA